MPNIDLTTLPGWSSLPSDTYNITIVAKADGYRDSEPSAAVSVTKGSAMPIKGDLITIDGKQYRVLKTDGNVAEVLCMYDASTSQKFDKNSSYNNTYAGKNIDTYCNNTFYSGLSSAMKNAIIDKTFTQDSWARASSVPTPSHYTGKYGSSTYYLTLINAAFGTSITRHCYVLSVQDVLDYLDATTSMGISDTTLTDTNLWKMVWNQTTSPGSTYPWLRSAYSGTSTNAFEVGGNNGSLGSNAVLNAYAVRPAFQIDLSKIEWTKSATLISFTITGHSYQAEEGMTWAEWVSSSYNTGGYYVDGTYIDNSRGRIYTSSSHKTPVVNTDIIVSGHEYYNSGSGGGAGN